MSGVSNTPGPFAFHSEGGGRQSWTISLTNMRLKNTVPQYLCRNRIGKDRFADVAVYDTFTRKRLIRAFSQRKVRTSCAMAVLVVLLAQAYPTSMAHSPSPPMSSGSATVSVCWSRRRARKLAARPVDVYAGMRTGTADVGRDDMPVDCSRDGRGARLLCFEIWEGPSRRGAFTIEMQIGLREKHQENIHQLLHFSTSWKK
jgi:hypothetical protein